MKKNPVNKFVSPEDIEQIRIPMQPKLNSSGDKAIYLCKEVDKDNNEYKTALHLLDIERKIDSEFTRGRKDSQASWHPNGKRILYLNNDEKDNVIRSISIYGGESRDILKLGPGRVTDLLWSPDGKTISFLMCREDGEAGNGAEKMDKTEEPLVREIDRLFYRLDGEGWEAKEKFGLYLHKPGTKVPRCIARHEKSHILAYSWSPDSKRIAYKCNLSDDPDARPSADSILITDTAGRSKVELLKDEGPVERFVFSRDGEKLYFTGHFYPNDSWGARNMELFQYDLSEGSVKSLTADLDRSLSGLSLGDITPSFIEQVPASDKDGLLYFTVSSEGGNPLYAVDPENGHCENILEGPEVIAEFNKADNEDCFILHLAQMERPDELWFLDLRGEKSLIRVTRLNDAYTDSVKFSIPEVHHVPVEGAMVQTWILKPPHFKEDRKYPMLLQIHGGPRGQYAYTWFHEMHVFAAAGYVVVYANPQGSQGYGFEFADAISSKWAEPAYNDLMSICDYMLEQGYIDEKRLFVTGGSYGGYMTNWIVSHTDRFRAAATQRCVSDLSSFFATSDIGWELEYEFGGTPWNNQENYVKWSPLTYADKINTPLLIIHSENDLRCPIAQAEMLFVRLRYDAKKVKFLRYPEESHGLSRGGRPDRRIHRLNELLKWFSEYL